jgi:hypothetical protein
MADVRWVNIEINHHVTNICNWFLLKDPEFYIDCNKHFFTDLPTETSHHAISSSVLRLSQ